MHTIRNGNSNLMMLLGLSMLCSFCQSTVAQSETPNESTQFILMQASSHIKNIESIQFTSGMELTISESGAPLLEVPGGTSTQQFVFYGQNSKYRAETSFRDLKTGDKVSRTSLFDGERYQLYDADNSILTLSNEPRLPNVTFGLNPLVMAYSFVFTPKDGLDFRKLKDPQSWEELEKRAKYKRIDRSRDGHVYTVLEFESQAKGETFFTEVHFAKDLGYFPLHSIVRKKDNTIVSRTVVPKFNRITLNGCEVIIPIELRTRLYDEHGNIVHKTKMTLEEGSIKVNQTIPDERFAIPLNQVDTVIDTDVGVQIPVKGRRAQFKLDNLGELSEQPENVSLNTQKTEKIPVDEERLGEIKSNKKEESSGENIIKSSKDENTKTPILLGGIVLIAALAGGALLIKRVFRTSNSKR